MSERTVVITGCSSGIGLAAAVAFASSGWDVVATMRDLGRAGALRAAPGGPAIDLRRLDVADDGSVASTLDAVAADHGGIEVVVSNAGVGLDGTTEELTLDAFRTSFETNVLGSVRLLHALLPAWRQRGSGRFIAVGSIAGVLGQPFNDAYCASKFALEGLLESLHPVVAQHGVHLAIVEPGPVAGEFAHRSGPPAGRRDDGPYAAARARFQVTQDSGYAAAQTPEQIAEILVRVAAADPPLLRYQTDEMVTKLMALKLKDLTGERVTGLTARWIAELDA